MTIENRSDSSEQVPMSGGLQHSPQPETAPSAGKPADSDDFIRRRRVAWGLILGSFATFAIICVSIPILGNLFLQNSRQPLVTSVATNQGTVALVQPTGETAALLAAEPAREVTGGVELLTNASDTALISTFSPLSGQLLMRGQMYGNTRIELETADAPRFAISSAAETLGLTISNGRLRLTTLEQEGRPFILQINTPQGQVNVTGAALFSLEVNNEETLLNVIEGEVEMRGGTEGEFPLLLSGAQRGVMTFNRPPEGPLETERNLIRNGTFEADFSSWTRQPWTVELSDQPQGETRLINLSGETLLRFTRGGIGHADAGVRQVINQDVTDFSTLHLVVSFRVNTQSLGVCGTVGSECPLTIRLSYTDANGSDLTWEQGFYASGVVADDTPDICVSCSPPYNPHKRILPGRVYVEEIDILSSLASQGFLPPRRLNAISLIAAGHTFETDIIDIAVIGEE